LIAAHLSCDSIQSSPFGYLLEDLSTFHYACVKELQLVNPGAFTVNRATPISSAARMA
jgi:hypothetical protein